MLRFSSYPEETPCQDKENPSAEKPATARSGTETGYRGSASGYGRCPTGPSAWTPSAGRSSSATATSIPRRRMATRRASVAESVRAASRARRSSSRRSSIPRHRDPEAEVEQSLERLGVDQVDLYIIHWPKGGPTWAWPGMEGARERGYTRVDRRLELQRRRARTSDGHRHEPARGQPGPVQPVRVPAQAARGVRGARRRPRGLQPAGHRSASLRSRGRAGRRARRANTGSGLAALGHPARRHRDPEVDPP